MTTISAKTILVGGGLTGGNVLVLDKNAFFGGSSTKATSGINSALTKTQIGWPWHQNSAKIFAQDTAQSARNFAHPDLIKVLTRNSASVDAYGERKAEKSQKIVSNPIVIGEEGLENIIMFYRVTKGRQTICNFEEYANKGTTRIPKNVFYKITIDRKLHITTVLPDQKLFFVD
ncbi:hypothetical protein C2G38_2159469 [Gigaspora rosea]|uniref:Uncharacterized protein n=1 Tax=Gigaspora rosea TaxID=44941 RepID=A0A397W8X6_9GLOM|nr:hypothetical protein C2G38_2159469 [Gigaspora rosea]